MTTTLTATVNPPTPRAQSSDGLRDQLVTAFARACRQLAAAQRRRAGKDTPAHRAAVADGRAAVDALLDLYLDLYPDPGTPRRPPRRASCSRSAVGSHRRGAVSPRRRAWPACRSSAR